MHVLLIYISVIMILRLITCTELEDIQDLSDWCSNSRTIDYHLTSGAGSSDKSVVMIATEKKLKCILKYSVKTKHNIMIVLEFPDRKPHEKLCITEQNTSITVSDFNENQMCQYLGSNSVYHRMSLEKMSLFLRSENEMSTIKITATSMRDAEKLRCSYDSEVECIVNQEMFCMTYKAACDGHNNCGVPDSFDEDKKKCKGRALTFLMVICSILMGVMSLFLFISLCMTLLPKRKETFVYKFDQTMSLFDSEEGIVSVEIDIQVAFPGEYKFHTQ